MIHRGRDKRLGQLTQPRLQYYYLLDVAIPDGALLPPTLTSHVFLVKPTIDFFNFSKFHFTFVLHLLLKSRTTLIHPLRESFLFLPKVSPFQIQQIYIAHCFVCFTLSSLYASVLSTQCISCFMSTPKCSPSTDTLRREHPTLRAPAIDRDEPAMDGQCARNNPIFLVSPFSKGGGVQ